MPDITPDGRYIAIEGGIAPGQSGGSGTQATIYDRVTDSLILATHTPGSPTSAAMGDTIPLQLSDDGRYLVYESVANNLVSGQSGIVLLDQVFLYDRIADSNLLVSHATISPENTANGSSGDATISSDGRYITFDSKGYNLVPNEPGNTGNVFLYDTSSNTLSLISRTSAGPAAAVGGSLTPVISADGRYITYLSTSTALVGGLVDGNATYDLFLSDLTAGTTSIVSTRAVDAAPDTAGDYSDQPSVSADGRFVVFESYANDLIAGVRVDVTPNIYIRDRQLNKTTLVSRQYGLPNLAAGASSSAQISADGRYVTFISSALNILSTPRTSVTTSPQLMLYDRVNDSLVLASHSATDPAAQAGGPVASDPAISGDGRYVVYSGTAQNLVAGQVDNKAFYDIFVYDRVNNSSTLVSHAAGALLTTGNADSTRPTISADGRYIAYKSSATNLIAGETIPASTTANLYIYDRVTGLNTLVTHTAADPLTAANATADSGAVSGPPQLRLSDDGQYLLYMHRATDLVNGEIDKNTISDLFLYNVATNSSILVSHAAGDNSTAASGGVTGLSNVADLSGDGRYVIYLSPGTNLVSGVTDSNSTLDVFLYDRTTGQTTLVDHVYNSALTPVSTGATGTVAISDDGHYASYSSASSSLFAPPYTASGSVLLLYDTTANSSTLASPTYNYNGIAFGSSLAALQRLSADGSVMVFESDVNLLAANDVNNKIDVFAFLRNSPISVAARFSYAQLPSTLSLTFGRDVGATLDASDLTLQNLSTGQTIPAASMKLVYDSTAHTATFTFPGFANGILPDGRYRATLAAGSVADTGGNPLSSDFVYDFSLLSGDTDGDGVVGDADLRTVLANMNTSARTGATGDLNGDGRVDFLDFQKMEISYGTSLPPLAAQAPAGSLAVSAKPAGSAALPIPPKSSPATLGKPSPATQPPAPLIKPLLVAGAVALSPAAALPAPLSAPTARSGVFSATPVKRRNDLLS